MILLYTLLCYPRRRRAVNQHSDASRGSIYRGSLASLRRLKICVFFNFDYLNNGSPTFFMNFDSKRLVGRFSLFLGPPLFILMTAMLPRGKRRHILCRQGRIQDLNNCGAFSCLAGCRNGKSF